MRSQSPTGEGFRLIFRRPAIPLAEVAWRWSLAAAFWVLVLMFLLEYADSLPVNILDRLLIGTRQPALLLRALHRIFHGSAWRFTTSGTLLALLMTVAWLALASLGRAATLKAIAEELGFTPSLDTRRIFSSFLGINLLRASTTLAAVVGGIGAVLISSGVWASTHWSLGNAARLWMALLFLVWSAWTMLNWLLSTSAIFVATEGDTAFGAISSTVAWYRDRLGAVLAAGAWFSLIHVGAFLTAFSAAFTVLCMAQVLGPGPTLFLEFLIIALYCAIANSLYIGRMTAYLAMLRHGDAFDQPEPGLPIPTFPGPETTSIDQSELILSDIPVPAT